MPTKIEYRKGVSGVVHPVGPQPPKVYWRRRIVFGVVLLLTLYVLSNSLFGGSGNSKAAPVVSTSPSTPSVKASQSPDASASASSQTSIDPSTDPIAEMTQTSAPYIDPTPPADACKDSDVTTKIAIDHTDIKAGAELGLTMAVKNTSTKSCKRDVGSGANEITIISGPALVWSTDHCSPGTESNYIDIAAGQTWKVHVIWNGKLSAKGCKILSVATHGAYWAHARNGAQMSTGARFVIE